MSDGPSDEKPQQPPPGEGTQLAVTRPKTLEEQLAEAKVRVGELEASLKEKAAFDDVLKTRRGIGYGAGMVAAGGLVALGVFSFSSLHSLVSDPYSKLAPSYFWAVIVGHALITVALVFFCYQVLRAAERLMLPYWWVEKHPEAARAMLGMMDPVTTATRIVEQVADAASKVAGAAAGSAKTQKP
jgi:hypothetical protein